MDEALRSSMTGIGAGLDAVPAILAVLLESLVRICFSLLSLVLESFLISLIYSSYLFSFGFGVIKVKEFVLDYY